MALIDNSDKVLTSVEKQVKNALFAIGARMEAHAKRQCPVDTGRLRGDITHATRPDAVYVGTNVEYAIWVETNDKAKHKPGTKSRFLRDSVANHFDEYEKIFEAALK